MQHKGNMDLNKRDRLRILQLIYDHPDNPWCGGGGAGRAWAINNILAHHHDITVLCGGFPNAKPQDNPFKVRFFDKAKAYVESRVKFMQESRKIDPKPYDLVVEEFSYYAPIFSRFSCRPLVTILHGTHGLNALRYRGLYGILSMVSEYLLLPRRRSVIVVSEHLRPSVKRADRVLVIGQGAEIPDNLLPATEEYVLFIGRLDVWHKGLDTLINAWSRLPLDPPSMPLYIIGGGDQKKIRTLINSAGADNIFILGRLDHAGAMSAIRKAAFLCMPSRMEGSPLVLYEAFALGKPVIASSIPAFDGLVQHEVNGLLVSPENPYELAKAIGKMIADVDLRSHLSRGAFEKGKEFNWDKIAEMQEKFYLETVEGFKKRGVV
ncbi:MAG: glycosyltransferase family 4 protein [Deltaproteobacteria bacterium]|nr:glycosyltransferase family 4 protein [Deltaproteobacteria bacterium]